MQTKSTFAISARFCTKPRTRRPVHRSVTGSSPSSNPRLVLRHEGLTPMPKVLIVEDDEVIADGMARPLRAAGFDPIWAGNGRTALARLRYEHAEVCVLDLM